MQDLRVFSSKADYEHFVFTEIFRDREIADHPFYRRLVQFVLDAKAPLFYFQSDPIEHANFSAYYHFVLRRTTYTNLTLESMYFLHDFAHMLFYYPHDMTAVSETQFERAVISSEYAASNETEVLLHYRAPGVRARVFQDRRLLYDVLRQRGVEKPSASSLLRLRELLVESDDLDPYFFLEPADEPVRATLKSYRDGNDRWCKRRLAESHALPSPTEYFYPFLTADTYERVLESFTSTSTQDDYERTTLRNLRLAFALLDISDPPRTFAEGLAAASRLEGRVLVRSIPREEPA